MSNKNLFLILVIVTLLVVSLYLYSKLSEQFEKQKQFKFIDDCETELLNDYRTWVMCCESDGKIYLCNSKTRFKPGEYIVIHANLQKLNVYFDSYYACGSSDIIEKEYPEKYGNNTMFSDQNFGCSKELLRAEYHHLTVSGYVPDKDEFTLLEVRIFPSGSYQSKEDFIQNINKSILVLSLKGGVGG